MSLHDAIKDLRGAAKRLDAATFNPNMNALAEFVDKLDTNGITQEPPIEVRKRALEKFLRGIDDFTRREIRALPFIIYESAVSLDGVKKILRQLDFDNRRHISGLVNVYLNQYDDSAKTAILRQLLRYMPDRLTENSRRLKKIFAAREFLFGDDRLANTAKLFAERQSVTGVLETFGLADSFKVSNFIQAALVTFYRMNNLAAQLKILRELDADFDAYKNIFPAVADALIQAVARAGFGKELCIEIFYERLGDPRFRNDRLNWHGVSEESKEIFLRWIAEDDLTIFFKITREALQGDVHALGMWDAREEFWREYLPRIGNTWVVLGDAAQRIAYSLQDRRTHGKLLGNHDADKSGFLFQIGKYIFAEWSHDGALRVYPAERVRNYIGADFAKTKMMKVSFDYKKVHVGAWQDEVRYWIAANC